MTCLTFQSLLKEVGTLYILWKVASMGQDVMTTPFSYNTTDNHLSHRCSLSSQNALVVKSLILLWNKVLTFNFLVVLYCFHLFVWSKVSQCSWGWFWDAACILDWLQTRDPPALANLVCCNYRSTLPCLAWNKVLKGARDTPCHPCWTLGQLLAAFWAL